MKPEVRRMPWTLALLALFPLATAAAPAPPREKPTVPFPIWPLPQEAEYGDERLLLRGAVIVVPAGDRATQYPGRLLAELIADHFGVALPIAVDKAPEGRTPLVVGDAATPVIATAARAESIRVPEQTEGYALVVNERGVVIAGKDYRGTLYGVSSFVQLVHRWGQQSVAVHQARIRDWPFLPVRWVHLYLPGRDQMGFARRYMRDFLLRHKFNGIVLETSGGMRFDSHPEISTGWQRTVAEWYAHGETIDKLGEGIPLGTANRFAASLHVGVGGGSFLEKDEVRHLAEWAADYGLEIVPEVQSLSHSYYIAAARREVAEDPDMRWPDSYCPSNPESYQILFDLLDETLDVLRPRRVHIGHDEWRAGAFCARCRGKDTGELFAEDVRKIQAHLEAKGLETWLWGDHFVDGHNRFGKRWSEGGVVRYERPDTRSARDLLAAGGVKLHVLNWSGEEGDATFKKLGWPYILGNFEGTTQKNWPTRIAAGGAQGGEVSSWGAWEEFILGKLQIPEATYSANLLWSSHYPALDRARAHVATLLPGARAVLSSKPAPSLQADPMRFEVLDITSAFNNAPKGDNWDLSGLAPGRGYANGLPYAIADPGRGPNAVRVARRPGDRPTRVELPVVGRWASLLFLQAATAEGRPAIHAGDQTHFPHESSELLGFYEIRYADNLVATHEIRYDETLAKWDAGPATLLYLARPVFSGHLPGGGPAVLWASEWPNPRPDMAIVAVTLVGSPGPSFAEPLLFGVTAVEKARVEDYQ